MPGCAWILTVFCSLGLIDGSLRKLEDAVRRDPMYW